MVSVSVSVSSDVSVPDGQHACALVLCNSLWCRLAGEGLCSALDFAYNIFLVIFFNYISTALLYSYTMQIPRPVKEVFDAFPLTTYPPVPAATPDLSANLEARKYYFLASSSASKTSSFILGVQNVVDWNDRMLPSDPVSLGQCLILCEKNGLSLPTRNAVDASSNCIMNLSYHAAPDRELPILIEDECALRTIISSSSILASNKKLLVPTDLIMNNLIDTKLYDLWTLCLLVEYQKISFNKIFTLNIPDESTASPLNSLFVSTLLQDVPTWRSFTVRHSSLFRDSRAKEIVATMINREPRADAIEAYYGEQLKELGSIIQLLADYVKENNSTILNLKLIAWLVLIDQTLSGTRLSEIVKNCKYLEEAYKYIEK